MSFFALDYKGGAHYKCTQPLTRITKEGTRVENFTLCENVQNSQGHIITTPLLIRTNDNLKLVSLR